MASLSPNFLAWSFVAPGILIFCDPLRGIIYKWRRGQAGHDVRGPLGRHEAQGHAVGHPPLLLGVEADEERDSLEQGVGLAVGAEAEGGKEGGDELADVGVARDACEILGFPQGSSYAQVVRGMEEPLGFRNR